MRETIPIEKLIRSYMDPTIEEDVEVSEETKIVNEEPIIESNGSTSGVDVDVEMPELAPSNSKLTTTASGETANADSDASSSEKEKESVSILETLEQERLKTAEAKELEAMREILADVESSSTEEPSSAGAEVKFSDNIMVKSIETDDVEADRESRRGYLDDGDDEDDRNTIKIGDDVTLDIGAESVVDGDSISILDDIQVLS
jgi:hypothetical protein